MAIRPKVAKTLAAVNERTKIAGKLDPKREVDASYFDVYDLEFLEGETPEEGGQTITISGNKFAIALQASLLDAIRELIRYELAKINNGGECGSLDRLKRSGHPEVKLFFWQKTSDASPGYQRIKGEISFDLINLVDSATLISPGKSLITATDIKSLSSAINNIFTAKYSWKRGKLIYTYHDWGRGYSFNIYCQSTAEAEKLCTDVLKIQGHKINKEFVKFNEMPYPIKDKSDEKVLDKQRKAKRYRPEVTVYYSHATLHLPTFGVKVPLG